MSVKFKPLITLKVTTAPIVGEPIAGTIIEHPLLERGESLTDTKVLSYEDGIAETVDYLYKIVF